MTKRAKRLKSLHIRRGLLRRKMEKECATKYSDLLDDWKELRDEIREVEKEREG